jgi:hypothetical protein
MRPALYDLGMVPTLALTDAQIQALTEADRVELRELGATQALLDRLDALASDVNVCVVINFEHGTLTIVMT